jgi:hypothetical protein
MKNQVRDFQQRMQGQQGQEETFQQTPSNKSSLKEGDYIDFEEIK